MIVFRGIYTYVYRIFSRLTGVRAPPIFKARSAPESGFSRTKDINLQVCDSLAHFKTVGQDLKRHRHISTEVSVT